MMMLPELYINAQATLGESPAWDAKTQTLYWVDVLERRVYAGAKAILQTVDYVGCVAPRRDGGLIVAQGRGLWALESNMKKLRRLATPRSEVPGNRFNDGKCDPRGRFLAGTMDHGEAKTRGSLYSLAAGGRPRRLLKDLRISNGMAWSPDGKTMYFTDTPTRDITAFDYDVKTGEMANPRVIIHFDKTFGFPDGMTTDTDGNLWIAMWGGGRISKWGPDGTLLEQFGVAARNVTSCVFGGANMNELFITSALLRTDAAALRRFPLAGAVFRMETNVTGMPTYEFAG
ncbi:MAG: SMP-30/gluconolactonase/LRE family protein [Anaerolineales bacterium]